MKTAGAEVKTMQYNEEVNARGKTIMATGTLAHFIHVISDYHFYLQHDNNQ